MVQGPLIQHLLCPLNHPPTLVLSDEGLNRPHVTVDQFSEVLEVSLGQLLPPAHVDERRIAIRAALVPQRIAMVNQFELLLLRQDWPGVWQMG